MLPISEDVLVQRLYARDESAMTLFYDKYGRVLYNVILRIVRNEVMAEDVLQESMVKIWYSFASYTASRGRLFTWALNVCRNAAIDQLRTRQYHEGQQTQALESSMACYQVAATGFQPEHVGLRELVMCLKPNDRKIIDLLYFGGFTQAEVADELQVPLGTVKTRARAAMHALAKAAR
ncbi:RNA polymerase sigma factor [Hymenobacter cellulosilyticus]|uniref:Sigma-70 family RNA polymerase sigma factor n=1 Tax=Hymenobacter cellulosilyticus TaxID=2932248 RepID=A0A8T9QAB8_9BACT|nr:sigma-70 family RNA polymerase sigma factor [Hymenobacter cellulosilyticus]UOQ72760.1 sigma-70 family RNA polymerase sigma factor [Hymenobacter cellulosilyticus]